MRAYKNAGDQLRPGAACIDLGAVSEAGLTAFRRKYLRVKKEYGQSEVVTIMPV